MIQREAGDGTYLSYEEEGFQSMPTGQPSRYCLMVSQSSAKTCKHKARWWVSYFSDYGSAAKATCDQHLAAALRFVQRHAAGGVGEKLPQVHVVEE